MAYSDFTFAKLKKRFGIVPKSIHLLKNVVIESMPPSDRLLEDMADAKEMPLLSEKAKSEALIFPILRELKKKNKHIAVFSGYSFNIDEKNGLTGAPDYLFSALPDIVEPQRPVFCLVETKNKTPDEGYAQCAAEMYAARVFNKMMQEPLEVIYGAVTNGFEWIFLKLDGNIVYVDMDRYYINELPKLLGIFQNIVDKYK